MNLKNLFPAALAGLIGVSVSACNPLAEKKKAEIEHILDSVQPTEDLVKLSQEYYGGRKDLAGISQEERASLVLGHAKLTRVVQGLKDGSLPFDKFYDIIVASQEKIITDKNTKLQTEFGGYYRSVSVSPQVIEFWTDPGHSNLFMENYKISQAELNGGELCVTVSGDVYETEVTDQTAKQRVDVNLSPKNGKHPDSKTLTIRLVLAK